MRKDRTFQKPETGSLETAPAMVLFINVYEGIRRKQLVKQTLIPWVNRKLKKLTSWIWKNPKILSWCYSYQFPTQLSNCYCSPNFIFSQCLLLDLYPWGLWLVAIEWKPSWSNRGKKKRISCSMLVSDTSKWLGHLPGFATDMPTQPVQICASNSQPLEGRKRDLTSAFLTGFMERINDLISIKDSASHRWLANGIRTTFFYQSGSDLAQKIKSQEKRLLLIENTRCQLSGNRLAC